jgi:hypothetical protein
MPQISYRANLAAASVPFSGPDQMGQSVIVPGPDHTFSRQLSARADQDRSVGIPQVYYIRNVIPVDSGFAAAPNHAGLNTVDLGFRFQGASNPEDVYTHVSVYRTGGSAQITYLHSRLTGQLHVFNSATPISSSGGTCAIYTLNGITYYFNFTAAAIYTTNGSDVYSAVTLTGIPGGTTLRDSNSCFGYHIAISRDRVFWSSLTDPLDFTPSLISGAGSFGIQQALGGLRFILPGASGFFIVCDENIVFLRYTGNPRFPFAAQAVDNSGPMQFWQLNEAASLTVQLADKILCSNWQHAVDERIIVTRAGIAKLSPRTVTAEFPELTQWNRDFPPSGVLYFPDADTAYGARVTKTAILSVIATGESLLFFRYNYTYLGVVYPAHWVYDIALQRWGHLDRWPVVSDAGRNFGGNSAQALLIVPTSGALARYSASHQSLVTSFNTHQGTMMAGRYQYVRARALDLHSVQTRGNNSAVVCRGIPSGTGSGAGDLRLPSRSTTEGLPHAQTTYYFDGCLGHNVSIMFHGAFYIDYLILNFSLHGKVLY